MARTAATPVKSSGSAGSGRRASPQSLRRLVVGGKGSSRSSATPKKKPKKMMHLSEKKIVKEKVVGDPLIKNNKQTTRKMNVLDLIISTIRELGSKSGRSRAAIISSIRNQQGSVREDDADFDKSVSLGLKKGLQLGVLKMAKS